MAINFVSGDTAPQLKITLKDSLSTDQVLDLTGAEVYFHIRAAGTTALLLTKVAELDEDPTTGVVYINWNTTDLLNRPAGQYEAEIEIYYPATNFRQTVYDLVTFNVRGQIA